MDPFFRYFKLTEKIKDRIGANNERSGPSVYYAHGQRGGILQRLLLFVRTAHAIARCIALWQASWVGRWRCFSPVN